MKTFVIKIDVDTDRGTQEGVPRLVNLLSTLHIPATFLFSLGPDNTGRAIKRIFRPGFLKKVLKSNVAGNYGLRTLLYGTLLPGPQIGKRHAAIMQKTKEQGFEVGIHCYDHIRWQDGVATMTQEHIDTELKKAMNTFEKIFHTPAKGAGAPGWQANEKTLLTYDQAQLKYGSDARGNYPFIPKIGDTIFKTLQIPTTLPTLDELLSRPDFSIERLTSHFLSLLSNEHPNVMTIHAELEGMKYCDWFHSFLQELQKQNIEFKTLDSIAEECFKHRDTIPICELTQGEIENRSGRLAKQCKKNKRLA